MATQYMDLFHVLDQSTKLLEDELKTSYLEAFIHSAENLSDGGKVYNENGIISVEVTEELEKKYKSIDLDNYNSEEIRKAVQLALLKGMKEDYIQPNHQMTPDSLGTLIAYLIEIITGLSLDQTDSLHLVDLSVGTGNLLLTIHHFLSRTFKEPINLSGIDNDELMLSIASTNAAIQRTAIDLQYQDSLQNLLLEPADIMVTDLPVGFYPLNDRVKDYKTYFNDQEHSYSHYLLIEQAMNYLKEDGFGFFMLPSNTFNDEQVSVLMNYLNEIGYILGIIQLPKELFMNKDSQKSVLIVQKRGPKAKQPKEVLLVNTPNFKDLIAMKEFLAEISQWKKDNI